jgi:PIN domain nuclease of toxin-antitoxin system
VTRAVLDASAILALLLEEPGASSVTAVLDDAAVSTVNLAEVVGQYARRGIPEAGIRAMLAQFSIQIVPFDEALAFAAGSLVPKTSSAGLSLGDRACLALARRLGAKALTADRSWSRIAAAVGVEVEVIR